MSTKIKGYRELTEKEITQINRVKHFGEDLEELLDSLIRKQEHGEIELDSRWVNIARTELQQGLMALVRAIAKPDSF